MKPRPKMGIHFLDLEELGKSRKRSNWLPVTYISGTILNIECEAN